MRTNALMARVRQWWSPSPSPAGRGPSPVWKYRTARRYVLAWDGQPVETMDREQLIEACYALADRCDKYETQLCAVMGPES